MQNYSGYMDKASTAALHNLQAGIPPEKSGLPSSDLGGPARIVPLVFAYRDDPDALTKAAIVQTKMPHTAVAAV